MKQYLLVIKISRIIDGLDVRESLVMLLSSILMITDLSTKIRVDNPFNSPGG